MASLDVVFECCESVSTYFYFNGVRKDGSKGTFSLWTRQSAREFKTFFDNFLQITSAYRETRYRDPARIIDKRHKEPQKFLLYRRDPGHIISLQSK
jgi:hypothetical protein